jgi:uncharacterized protein YuzE
VLEYKYDREADAIYITLRSDQYAYGKDLDDDRRIDYASNQQPIGIELLSVSRGVNLHNVPFTDSVLEILDSEGIKSYSFISDPYAFSTSRTINATFVIQFSINKELTGVS